MAQSSSKSDCSDDSFEIVSAEIQEDEFEETISMSYKPLIKFQEMFDVYPLDTDIVSRISYDDGFVKSENDKVVVLPLAWISVDQALCSAKIIGTYVKLDVKELPKSESDKFYQLCYCNKENIIVGVSIPFSFREVHEYELAEFQKGLNRKFWTFRSRFAVLMDIYWNSIVENKIKTENCESESKSNQNSLIENEQTDAPSEPKSSQRCENTRSNNELQEVPTTTNLEEKVSKRKFLGLRDLCDFLKREKDAKNEKNALDEQLEILRVQKMIPSVEDSSHPATALSSENANALQADWILVTELSKPNIEIVTDQLGELNVKSENENRSPASPDTSEQLPASSADVPEFQPPDNSNSEIASINKSAARFMVTETGNVLHSQDYERVNSETLKILQGDGKFSKEHLVVKITELQFLNDAYKLEIDDLKEKLGEQAIILHQKEMDDNEMRLTQEEEISTLLKTIETLKKSLAEESSNVFGMTEVLKTYDDNLKLKKESTPQEIKNDRVELEMLLENLEIELCKCNSKKDELLTNLKQSESMREYYYNEYKEILRNNAGLKSSLQQIKIENIELKDHLNSNEIELETLRAKMKTLQEEREKAELLQEVKCVSLLKKEEEIAVKLVSLNNSIESMKIDKENMIRSLMVKENLIRSLASEKETLIESFRDTRIDLENRLKEGAKEYAKLFMKYKKRVKYSSSSSVEKST